MTNGLNNTVPSERPAGRNLGRLLGLPQSISKWQFLKDLYYETGEDQVFNGAAALAYYFFLAIFPAMIFLLSLLPYLPIHNLHQIILDLIGQVLPKQAALSFEGVISEVTQAKRSGLLSIGAVLTLWTASSGLYAIMQQLNVTYDVNETRPYWRARGLAVLLTLLFTALIAVGCGLIVFGGAMQDWLGTHTTWSAASLVVFQIFRWLVVLTLLLGGFAITYYFGPDVEQSFRFITPGAVIGVLVMAAATVGFRVYVENFSNYAATYGSIGAVIILMLWLYIVGLVMLLGSEINALIEHYSPTGKNKGERDVPSATYANVRGFKKWTASPKGRPPLPGRGLEPARAERKQAESIEAKGQVDADRAAGRLTFWESIVDALFFWRAKHRSSAPR